MVNILEMKIEDFKAEFMHRMNNDIFDRRKSLEAFRNRVMNGYWESGYESLASVLEIQKCNADTLADYDYMNSLLDEHFDWELFRLLLHVELNWYGVDDICTYHGKVYNLVVDIDGDIAWHTHKVECGLGGEDLDKAVVKAHYEWWDNTSIGAELMTALDVIGATEELANHITSNYQVLYNKFNGTLIFTNRG